MLCVCVCGGGVGGAVRLPMLWMWKCGKCTEIFLFHTESIQSELCAQRRLKFLRNHWRTSCESGYSWWLCTVLGGCVQLRSGKALPGTFIFIFNTIFFFFFLICTVDARRGRKSKKNTNRKVLQRKWQTSKSQNRASSFEPLVVHVCHAVLSVSLHQKHTKKKNNKDEENHREAEGKESIWWFWAKKFALSAFFIRNFVCVSPSFRSFNGFARNLFRNLQRIVSKLNTASCVQTLCEWVNHYLASSLAQRKNSFG